MTTATMPATEGTRVVGIGDVRFVDLPDTGVREVEARICSYGVGPDTYQTTWAPGWAEEGIREALASGTPIPMVFGHDERNIANVVGSLVGHRDQADGLYARMRMANFDEVPSARACHSLLRDRHIAGWSYKFRDGQTVSDPNHRGALMFTKARLVHVSPVIDPSVPGTTTTSVRSTDGDGSEPSALDVTLAAIRSALEGRRDVTLTILSDGTVTTDAGTDDTGSESDGSSVNEFASAIDGAVDAALALAAQLDLTTLPAEVGQLVQLLHAADVAADELLEALGLPDPDGAELDDDTIQSEARSVEAEQFTYGDGQYYITERAAKEPYGDVEYADPGYQDDKQKRYPIDTAEHVRAAWSYINKSHNADLYTAEQLASIKDRIKAAAKKLGVDIADDSSRDTEDAARTALNILDQMQNRR
jgi:phage head maturation protease